MAIQLEQRMHSLLPQLIHLDAASELSNTSEDVTSTLRVMAERDDFLAEAKADFERPIKALCSLSKLLRAEYEKKLETSPVAMLPSFQHSLPTGQEATTILALDVGGSTFRIAIIELSGNRSSYGHSDDTGMEITSFRAFAINDAIRALIGNAFFEWMASCIKAVLSSDSLLQHLVEQDRFLGTDCLTMALTWSFPMTQTSSNSGLLLPMGKGFLASQGLEGHEIGELVVAACRRQNLELKTQAIINDASATFLSRSYHDPGTRLSLILGTGINAAAYLPVNMVGKAKFASRSETWWKRFADGYVLVNTELSISGKGLLMSTRWDDRIASSQTPPDFQPLEYKTSGKYIGEVVRQVLVEAAQTGLVFGGRMPLALERPFSLDTSFVAHVQGDESPGLAVSRAMFVLAYCNEHENGRSTADLEFVHTISRLVSTRAAAYTAAAVHALLSLQESSGYLNMGGARRSTIACTGSVIEKYPGFREVCQEYLNDLCAYQTERPRLRFTSESSLYGAAVAAAAAEL